MAILYPCWIQPCPCSESLPLSPGPSNALRPTQVEVNDLSQVTFKEFLKDNTISQQIMTHLHPHEPLQGAVALARDAMWCRRGFLPAIPMLGTPRPSTPVEASRWHLLIWDTHDGPSWPTLWHLLRCWLSLNTDISSQRHLRNNNLTAGSTHISPFIGKLIFNFGKCCLPGT